VRIVFLGTPQPAVPSLDALVASGHDVQLVVTRPDRPIRRSSKMVPPPVKSAAMECGIEVHQPSRVRGAAFVSRLAECRPDVLVVVAYGRILTRAVLDVAPLGAVNLHFSLLPAYRGAAPVQWALANGEVRTGVSTMLINEGLDEGDVLLQESVEVGRSECAPELQERLALTGAALLTRTLAELEEGALSARPQDSSAATLAPILTPADGRIDFSLTAREIEGRIRGFDPWPGVWVASRGRRTRLVAAVALSEERSSEPPGQIISGDGEGLHVVCGDGSCLRLVRIQLPGKRAVAVREALNGRQISVGEQLEGLDPRGEGAA
jgi:methionyl-tRNA formyltransferase